MTLYLDPDTGDLVDGRDESLIGTADHESPYTLPDDAKSIIGPQVSNDVSKKEIHWVLDVAGGDVEFGTPPDSS